MERNIMSTERIFDDPALETLRKRYFPRVPWGPDGPVRRRYLAQAADGDVAAALEALALSEGFIAPGGRAVQGGPEVCLAAFRQRDGEDRLVFGRGQDVCWCDLALSEPDDDGWQVLTVRSETAENLVALASASGAVRFKKV